MKKNTPKIAIIGAGASGLIASIVASRNGADVTLFEQNHKVGKKLLATGNGRCNITNNQILLSNYYSKDLDILEKHLKKYPTKTIIDFFHEIGLEIIEGENGRLYPMSLQASSVVDLLFTEATIQNVTFIYNTFIDKIEQNGGKFKIDGIFYDKVLLSNGSNAMSKLGGNSSGFELASWFGHSITPTLPSLVQIVSNEPFLEKISGVKVDAKAILKVNNEQIQEIQGDILFTKYGLSGSAILDISRNISHELSNQSYIEVIIDLLPNYTKKQFFHLLEKRLKNANNKAIKQFLVGIINTKLIDTIIEKSNLQSKNRVIELNAKDLNKIVYTLKNISLIIAGTKGFESCEVVTGGVKLTQINIETMESKIVKNLFFAGEILDVDGDCGGYNLHFAWSSGIEAGKNLAI